MDTSVLTEFAARAHAQAFGHILPFWYGPALDREQGGWLPWMNNDLSVDRSQPKGLIVNTRILWAFSAAFRAGPSEILRGMAQRAFKVVTAQFWDAQFDGCFWQLEGSGKVRVDAKKIYGQAFCIYALAEYCQAFAIARSGEPFSRARTLFELIESHARDLAHGGYFEVCRRDWSAAEDSRLSEKDMNEKKSMNNHLHVLEAYTNLYRIWKEPRLKERLRELIDVFETRILDRTTKHFHHFFDESWNVRSDTYTFGHDIEGSWLLCEAAELLEDTVVLGRIQKLAVEICDKVLAQALDADGGICYEGRQGRVIDRRKECWPQAEAVVGFLNAYQLSGRENYLQAARRVWGYIESNLVDKEKGEWFWRINMDGRPDPNLPKVSEWKGPYHGTRACLEIGARLQRICQTGL